MLAVEFQTQIKDGTIEIPTEYREDFKDRVRVILMVEEPLRAGFNLIDQLLQTPIRLEHLIPFTREEVYARS